LGIGDWAQSPIPNPQSPIPNPQSPIFIININVNEIIKKKYFKLRFIKIIHILIKNINKIKI
jgi:hypothetical protein